MAAGLPAGSEVLTAVGDFTSILFPFHAQAARGVTVREVALEEIADAVSTSTTLVAVSAVQSADGRLVDLDRLEEACAVTGTKVLLDTTQAVGWLPIDASRFAYTVCGGYKWLLAPRGTAYLTIQAELLDSLTPHTAGWYAGARPWESIYGAPLRLAPDARRFDVSPAWHAWSARHRPWSYSPGSASRPYTPTPLAWPTNSAPGSACPPGTRPSSRPWPTPKSLS